ncbi:peptidase inhibitor family I36 protein [Phycicoccus jejuensis]|uniref:peptidase inhibitor family I36 protein n=1 Tax=Phycicoccus jejuensis TaxID=367299 RepID=UPI001470786B|nr:peptidase inhibitor family I36 protein [Phycicoccus jejuensis]
MAAAPSASAATGYDRCPNFKMCVFTGPNGTGVMATFSVGDANLGDNIGPTGMNNNIESTYNRTGHDWDLWDGAGYTGEHWVSHTHYDGHGRNVYAGIANRVSSLHDY